MNIDICKKCIYSPYIYIDTNKINQDVYLACGEKDSRDIFAVAKLNDDILDAFKELFEEGYSTQVLSVKSATDEYKEALKHVDVNKGCPYYIEQEIDFIAENE